ncbi:pyridoxamine 5'-phosphate oxidase family protein [bacterium]|nr:pyridoxamine 5'-phosphate oxidase family protein [bacterium]
MKHPLRRKDRELSAAAALTILQAGEYGVVSSVGADGQPYGVPVSYTIFDGCIEFHSALEGHKISNFMLNQQVSFCVVGKTELLQEKFSTRYESAIVFGKIIERTGESKIRSLQALIAKYSPMHIDAGDLYIETAQQTTRVFSISIDQITGKARR